jgi:hypothetical protein
MDDGPDERVERIARQLGEASSALDAELDPPVDRLDRALAGSDAQAVADALYRLVLGRPPEPGSQAAEALAAGGSAIDLALTLVESDEAVRRGQAARLELLAELRHRGLRQSWFLPPTGDIGPLLRDPGTPLVLATLRVAGGSADQVAAARQRLRTAGDRDEFLRAEWREWTAALRGPRSSPRGVASRARHGWTTYGAFRSHVLAVLPAAESLVVSLALRSERDTDLAELRTTLRATAARVDEIAAGVRLLLQDHPW